MRKRGLVLLAVTIAATVVGVVAAWAGFPNILRYKEPTLVNGTSTGALALAAASESAAESTESGLTDPRVLVEDIVVVGIKEGVATTLTARYSAVYVCVNGGGNVPDAANKLTLAGVFETGDEFDAVKNGKATGLLLTDPLPSAEDAAALMKFACPSGQTLEFDHVVFSELVLSVDGGETVPLDITLVSDSVHGLN